MNLKNTKAAAIGMFIGTLLLGIFIGVLADRWLLQPAFPFGAARRFEGPHPEGRGRLFMKHFAQELDLSPPQQAQLDSILASNRQRFDGLRRSMHPRFSALRDSLDQQILAILTPPQREKFETLKAEKMLHGREFKLKRKER